MRRAAALAALLLSGCTTVSVEMEHISHPLAGWPVGPSSEEDWVHTVGIVGRKEYGRWYVEQGLGYNVAGRDGGGFVGPGLTYTGRVGVQVFRKGSLPDR